MKTVKTIVFESQMIRNLATKTGNNLSDNTDRKILPFSKEEILKMTDSEIKEKISFDTYYNCDSNCGIIFRIIEVEYSDEESDNEIINENVLKTYTFIEDGAWPNDFEMSDIFKN